MAEKIVAELIKRSSNYELLYENTQLIENKATIGEIDFIIEEKKSKELIHLELAYKFYVLDSNNNWIGPNRKDALTEKLEKLKTKQFPLLHHDCAKSKFENIEIGEVRQVLCLLASLFIPYQHKKSINPIFQHAIKGYYLTLEKFLSIHNSSKTYYLPSKQEWGIEPSENENWANFKGIEEQLQTSIKEKQSPLCWQKNQNSYSVFFIVWW